MVGIEDMIDAGVFVTRMFLYFQSYATTFPVIGIEDMVNAQFQLLDYLGIEKVRQNIALTLSLLNSQSYLASHPDPSCLHMALVWL